MKTLSLTLLIVGLLIGPVAQASPEDEPTAMAMTGDLLIARPLGAAITLVGAVAFVVSLPFSALGGNVQGAADALVVAPAREAFVRCLGCKSATRYRNNAR